MELKMLKCGLAEVDITPILGSIIPGQFHVRYSTGVKDNLFAKAVVIGNGENTIAIVAMDALFVDSSSVAGIRERIKRTVGIPEENIMVSATHTHTGGPVCSWGDYIRKDPVYIDFIIDKCADAAIMAYKKMKPAVISFGKGCESGISFNRRFLMKDGTVKTNAGIGNPDIVKPSGPIDPDVTIIRVDDENGNIIGVITNFACHLDVVGGDEYSGDYPGELSRILKKAYGDHVVSLFLTGTCGNINHVDASGRFAIQKEHYIKMGRILAGEVVKTLERTEVCSDVKLEAGSRLFELGVRQPSAEDLLKAKELLDNTKVDNSELIKETRSQLVETFYAKEAIRMHEEKEKSVYVEVQVLKIGDLAISALPGEIFVEFGLDIKKRSPFKYNMANSLANGCFGYIPVREAFSQGGYEPRLCATSRLEEEAGYKMADAAVELLEKL
ncbi:MAG TPA: neutral/alkaline non-lysosomal ceramidase N-terminal domain-containing protein [Clostridiales bacterium]|nr:neutral/alkaline non-lysosomal ceramidase N-terminal domain-containing protein [Clostridiales bacterium]